MKIMARPAFKNKLENPYNYLLYSNLESLGVCVEEFSVAKLLSERYDILHLHWPEDEFIRRNELHAISLTFGLLALVLISRLKGTKIVWTAHNLRSHNNLHPRSEDFFWQIFVKQLDGFISLSHTAAKEIRERYPILHDCSSTVTPHGHYRNIYPNKTSREESRQRLGINLNSRVVAFVGKIRPYKNIPHLIRTFQEWSDSSVVLLIAGKPDSPEAEQRIRDIASRDTRVKLSLDLIPDEQLQYYLNAADLVVLPYSKILNSGTALLSLSFNCPVLVPILGSLQELQQIVGDDWLKTYTGNLTCSDLINATEDAIKLRSISVPVKDLDWEIIAQDTLEFYESLISM